jgi:hypothetical protein
MTRISGTAGSSFGNDDDNDDVDDDDDDGNDDDNDDDENGISMPEAAVGDDAVVSTIAGDSSPGMTHTSRRGCFAR